jgi:hypothetical protein
MLYAHIDGGVSAVRCLDQSVDEPQTLQHVLRVGAFAAPTKASVARTSQSKVFRCLSVGS